MAPMSADDWIERVYSDVPGTLVVSHEDARGTFHGTGGQCATHDDAVQRIERFDAAGARGVYLRVTTVQRSLGAYERGTAADSGHLPGLWADVDLGDVGHVHNPSLYDGRTLPPDEDAARQIVADSGLPAPSLWVHSGGGLYPWWLLDHPAEVTDENRATLEALSTGWQEALASSAARLGYHYGTGVGDLARVLRVPGTTNRKAGLERPCRLIEDQGTVYALDDLLEAVPDPAGPDTRPRVREPVRHPVPCCPWGPGRVGRGQPVRQIRRRDLVARPARPLRLYALHRRGTPPRSSSASPAPATPSTRVPHTSWPSAPRCWSCGPTTPACRSARARS